MTSWTNNGSYQDLSDLSLGLKSLAPTSQAGGNMLAGTNAEAMTAPGSQPVDNLNDHVQQAHEDPTVEVSNSDKPLNPGDDGKPKARGEGYTAHAPAWGKTTVPKVTRE